jgi:signal transduction histidine kinase
LEIILSVINAQARSLLDTDAVAVYRLQKNGLLTIQSSIGLDDDYISLAVIPLGVLATGRAAQELVPINIPDIAKVQNDPNSTYANLGRLLERLTATYRAILSVPLIIRGETYGALTLYYSQPSVIPGEEMDLAVTFANQVALAIENAGLRAQIEEQAVAAERSRLGRELHDSVSQMLFSANLIADVLPAIWQRSPEHGAEGLAELRQLTHGALAEMRTLLAELRPSVLEAASLEELLRQLTRAASGRMRFEVGLQIQGQAGLPRDVKLAFYRIAQEALNNIIKYASADQVDVTLSCGERQAELIIRDNGCGFDPQAVSPNHLGLDIMRERAQSVGARLALESQSECGTQITLRWNIAQP